MADIYGFDEAKNKVTLSDGTGITIGDDGTINHTNNITEKTAYVGGSTSVPMIKCDAQGHITEISSQTIYPPTTAGTAGQVWTSDGSGVGKWADASSGGSNFISINGYKQEYEWMLESTFLLKGTSSVTATEYNTIRYDTFNSMREISVSNGVAYARDVKVTSSTYEDNVTLHKYVGAIESLINVLPAAIKINGDYTGSISIRACPYAVSASDGTMTNYDDCFCEKGQSPYITLNYVHSVLQDYTSSFQIYGSSADSDYLPKTKGAVISIGWYLQVVSVSGSFA